MPPSTGPSSAGALVTHLFDVLEPEGRVFYGLLDARPAQEMAGQVELNLSLRALNLLWYGNATGATVLHAAQGPVRYLRCVFVGVCHLF